LLGRDSSVVDDGVDILHFARHKQIVNLVANSVNYAVKNLFFVGFGEAIKKFCALQNYCGSMIAVSFCDVDESLLLHFCNSFEIYREYYPAP